MSVPLCSRCKSHYWRFNASHPPPGYCSLFCYDNRKAKSKPPAPPAPHSILSRMYDHRRTIHGSPDILPWYDCKICDELEKEYYASLEWHSAAAYQAMAEERSA